MPKQGTISVLFGCHSIIHSILVSIAWYKVYNKPPNLKEVVCIFIHDIGHWGKDYLDDYNLKRRHHIAGAKIAKFFFGNYGYNLVAGHNAYNGQERSKLFYPDKYSWIIAPKWWMWTNTIFEPKLMRKGSTRMGSVNMFKKAILENWNNGLPKQGHDIYLEQRG